MNAPRFHVTWAPMPIDPLPDLSGSIALKRDLLTVYLTVKSKGVGTNPIFFNSLEVPETIEWERPDQGAFPVWHGWPRNPEFLGKTGRNLPAAGGSRRLHISGAAILHIR
jgi:hypothetical protein